MDKINESNRLLKTKSNENNRSAEKETLEYYKLNSERFKSELTNEKDIDDQLII